MTTIPLKDNTHGWSVADFEAYRKPLTCFLKERILPLLDAAECRRILIRAPVKSGKREMVEYLAVRDQAHSPHRVHAFVSSFHRVADEEQRDELKIHNMRVFSLRTKTQASECVEWVRVKIAAGKQVVLHIDECDFGAGEKQILSKVYNEVRNKSEVTTILYSATPQEVLFSGDVDDEEFDVVIDDFINTGEWIQYEPPEGYCGSKKFLDAGLVIEARPFFTKEGSTLVISEQGKEILREARANAAAGNGRNIVILRLSYSSLGGTRAGRKENKAIYQFLHGYESIPELADFLVYADKGEKITGSAAVSENIQWSKRSYWRGKTKDEPILMVIDQTSSRSTEWSCHNRVYAYHDFRNAIVFSTVSQAQERVDHYAGKYGGFQPIKVYGHVKTFLLSAGRIDYATYMTHDWKARKVDRRSVDTDEPRYEIIGTASPHPTHPRFPRLLSEAEKDMALQELGCYVDVKVSPRVRGTVRTMRVFQTEFFPCQESAFSALKPLLDARWPKPRGFDDPFARSRREGKIAPDGKIMGYLREWKVFEYESEVMTQPGWGVGPDEPRITICYRRGVLGVAARWDTRVVRAINSLEAFKSMYAN